MTLLPAYKEKKPMLLTRRSALLALGGTALLATPFRGAKAEADPIDATIAYGSTGYTWALSFVAEGIDAWKKEGVTLTALDFPTGRESMQALLGGSAQFATSTDTPVIFAAGPQAEDPGELQPLFARHESDDEQGERRLREGSLLAQG
jgi:ABC-type nitrate/sulfonate/bicarbonate transport system substrate-binding protein